MTGSITSRRVVTLDGVRAARVVFENGRISAIEDYETSRESNTVNAIDVGDLWLLPGLIDSHVHINEPGRSEWEGFRTATRAAAAGGYTCLVDMPLNSIPATTNVDALAQKRAAARGTCLVDYAFWGGAVEGNAEQLLALAEAGVCGFKSFLVHPGIEEFTMVTERDLHLAMPFVAQSGLPLLVHAELPERIADANRLLFSLGPKWTEYNAYLASRPHAAETEAIQLMIRLCREHRCRVHIVHLSSAEALPLLREARREGLPITVETCPHYLYFSAEQIGSGATQFKCAPPIREASNREQLWDGLREGVIDLVATDHSPCPPAMKNSAEGDFATAWGGIASLSVAFSATWTAARQRGFELPQIIDWMSRRPAELAGIDSAKGQIASDFDADFVVFDPDAAFRVQPEDLHFRHAVSPYLGESLQGRVKMTFVRGHRVFHDGSFATGLPGRECRVRRWRSGL